MTKGKPKAASQHQQPPNFENPSRAMQWAGLIIVTLLTLATLIAVYVTKNLCYLVLTIPLGFMWRSLAQFLYKRKEDYDLETLKIKASIAQPSKRSYKKKVF